MREFLNVVWQSPNGDIFESRFEIFRDCVYEESVKADMAHRYSFKEALRTARYEVERASDVHCSPDFWETLEFRAREWSSRK